MEVIRAKTKAMRDKRLEAKIDANQMKTDDNQERMDVNLKEMREEIKFGQAEMRSTICVFRSELEETIQHGMRAVIQPIWAELDEMTACNGATN
jgi:hypothetical protein